MISLYSKEIRQPHQYIKLYQLGMLIQDTKLMTANMFDLIPILVMKPEFLQVFKESEGLFKKSIPNQCWDGTLSNRNFQYSRHVPSNIPSKYVQVLSKYFIIKHKLKMASCKYFTLYWFNFNDLFFILKSLMRATKQKNIH